MGGSIGMVQNQKTGRIDPVESLSEIHRFLPEAQREVALDFHSLANVGSSEVTPSHWVDICNTITNLYDSCEGFVVIHGTNTMSYTACAVAFALQNLSKPIVFTGSLLPLNDLGSDGRMNLTFAIRAAQLDIAEVCVVLGPHVLRGVRSKKVEQSIFQTFDTPKFPPLAEFNATTMQHPNRFVRRKRVLSEAIGFDPDVVSITVHPGMPEKFFDAVLAVKPHGIVLRAYGPGMLPEGLFPWMRKVTKAEIPLVITSQLLRSSIDLQFFRKQLQLEELGVISGKDMTYECAVVKLMWALNQTASVKKVQELMEKNLVGEMD